MRKTLIMLLVLGALVAAASVWAAIPDTSGKVNACYRNTTGEVRVSDTSCLGDETALVLNAVPGYQVVSLNDAENNGAYYFGSGYPGTYDDIVDCPSGKTAVGGGIEIYGSDSRNAVISSFPTTDSGLSAWHLKWRDFPANGAEHVNLYAVCVIAN